MQPGDRQLLVKTPTQVGGRERSIKIWSTSEWHKNVQYDSKCRFGKNILYAPIFFSRHCWSCDWQT